MLRYLLGISAIAVFVTGCSKNHYSQLPRSTTIIPPWYSNIPQLANSFGFQNLGTAVSPSVLYLSDNNANDGDILSIALNGQVVNQNIRITTPDAGPPHAISMTLNQGQNQVDILCVTDPGGGCTLQAEISNTTAGAGLTTINQDPVPEGEYASFIVEYKPN
nr:hypothetical protein [Synechococcus sp. AH-603-L18]